MTQNHEGIKQSFYCQCIRYGKIDVEKFERLKKNHQKRMCVWINLSPFSSKEPKRKEAISSKIPLFPPIFMIPMKTVQSRNELRAQRKHLSLPKEKIWHSMTSQECSSTCCIDEERLPSRSLRSQRNCIHDGSTANLQKGLNLLQKTARKETAKKKRNKLN